MPNYENGKIYKLICDKTDKIYIGSTTKKLNDRLSGHKNNQNCSSKQLLELGEVKIKLIQNYPCNNKKELETKERYYIEKYKDIVINKIIPTRTKKEYYKENKEKILHYCKKWNQENKEIIKQKKHNYYEKTKELVKEQYKEYRKIKITCECGSIIPKYQYKRHYRSKKHQSFLNNKV